MGIGREWRVFWQRVEFVRRPPRKTALPALDSEPRDIGSSVMMKVTTHYAEVLKGPELGSFFW